MVHGSSKVFTSESTLFWKVCFGKVFRTPKTNFWLDFRGFRTGGIFTQFLDLMVEVHRNWGRILASFGGTKLAFSSE